MRSRSPAARVHYDGTGKDDESNQRQQDRVRLTEGQSPPVPPTYILTGLRSSTMSEQLTVPVESQKRGAIDINQCVATQSYDICVSSAQRIHRRVCPEFG